MNTIIKTANIYAITRLNDCYSYKGREFTLLWIQYVDLEGQHQMRYGAWETSKSYYIPPRTNLAQLHASETIEAVCESIAFNVDLDELEAQGYDRIVAGLMVLGLSFEDAMAQRAKLSI